MSIFSRTFPAALLTAWAGTAGAADLLPARMPAPAPPPAATSGWAFQATLYGWATSLNGDIGLASQQPIGVNVGFDEILSDLKGAFMGSFQARNDTWLVLLDAVWSEIGSKQQTRFGGQLDYSQTLGIYSGYVGYRIPVGTPDFDLRLIGGVRGQSLDADISHVGVQPAFNRTASGSKAWVDPVLGFSAVYNFDKRWFLTVIGDVGGFGVSSQLTAQGFAAVGYRWTDTISTSIGYRALYTDYKSGGFTYETTLHGLFVGLGAHF